MLVVREQDDVDRPKLVEPQRRASGLDEPAILAGRRERGISQPPQTGVLEHRRRTAYKPKGQVVDGHGLASSVREIDCCHRAATAAT